jgi:hypothetical protein
MPNKAKIGRLWKAKPTEVDEWGALSDADAPTRREAIDGQA